LSWRKKVLFSIITLAGLFLVLELFFRVIFSFYVGPSVLLYGTPFDRQKIQPATRKKEKKPEAKTFLYSMPLEEWYRQRNVEIHPNEFKGYSKYFAKQKRIDFDLETGESFDVTINDRGFRGRNFSDHKEPGVIRVLCLGASSTFGYFDRDDETYPVYLEQILNERYPGQEKFEVINFGIPHLSSGEINNLFLAEGIRLEPDIVTFYEGNNDCEPPQQWLNKSYAHAVIKKIGRTLIIAKFIDSISSKYLKILYPSMSDKFISDISNNFIENISRINKECRDTGILFIVANQQKNSQSFDRDELKDLTYQEEVAKTLEKLRKTGALLHPELQFLIHSELMKKLKPWAKTNHVPFVDVIARLDHDRDVLVSWVHLSPKGNQMVAEALAERILEYDYGN